MNTSNFFMIGLMSGTSLDGLDICYVQFSEKTTDFKIINSETVIYDEYWLSKLRSAPELSAIAFLSLDIEYGIFLGKQVNLFVEKYQLEHVDAIASHGHTIFHQPNRLLTKQIGHGAAIFKETNIVTVADFRTQDVIMGGQGAPLVPIGDQLLFGQYPACLNLGGFSNISYQYNEKRVAFDICPVNCVLNSLAQSIGFDFDRDGLIAREGKVIEPLIERLNSLDFYEEGFPKSLGIEWVNKHIFPLFENSELSTEDLLSTFTHHVAYQLAKVLNEMNCSSVLITGGGAMNKYLIECIQKQTTAQLVIPNQELIDYKEALVFAFLGFLRLKKKINILASVTGASRNHSSGVIYGDFD